MRRGGFWKGWMRSSDECVLFSVSGLRRWRRVYDLSGPWTTLDANTNRYPL